MLLNLLKKLGRNENGFAVVLVAAALTVILGFTALVVDVGALYLTRDRLINACDAAALAGAWNLPDESQAADTAEVYLQNNNIDPENAEIIVSDDKNTISVKAENEMEYYFAKVLGFESQHVGARAEAQYGAITSATGVAPLSVPEQELEFGNQYVLKNGAWGGEEDGFQIHGNFGALAMGGTGANNYEDNLKNGYDGTIEIGDYIDTEPGNMSGPTYDGITHLINECNHGCTPDDYKADCPRVLLVPIYDPDTMGSGRDEVKIVGFGAFFLQGVEGQGNESTVTGTFLEMAPPPDTSYTVDPEQEDYGIKTAVLVE